MPYRDDQELATSVAGAARSTWVLCSIRQEVMIPSGSLVPGIDPASFCLPAGTALRYERPVAALNGLVASYAVLDSDPAVFKGPHSWLLPGWARLWIVLTAGRITVRARRRQPDALGTAMLFGSTSCALPATTRGGISVVIDLTPAGWARWVDQPADGLRDQIAPLDRFWPAERTRELVARLYASDRSTGVKAVLDDLLSTTLPPPHRDEAALTAIVAALGQDDVPTAAEAAATIGVSSGALLRLTNRHFGYSIKLLARRTRFLRVLTEMMMADEPADHGATPTGYYSVPHFLRDAKEFLGLTPRRFLALPMPYLRAALRARSMVIGAPVPLLDRAPLAEC